MQHASSQQQFCDRQPVGYAAGEQQIELPSSMGCAMACLDATQIEQAAAGPLVGGLPRLDVSENAVHQLLT